MTIPLNEVSRICQSRPERTSYRRIANATLREFPVQRLLQRLLQWPSELTMRPLFSLSLVRNQSYRISDDMT